MILVGAVREDDRILGVERSATEKTTMRTSGIANMRWTPRFVDEGDENS
jgi:hypothetical protein